MQTVNESPELKINNADLKKVKQPSPDVYQPMGFSGYWLTPSLYMVQHIGTEPLVRFIGERVESDHMQTIILIDDDPEDLLDKIFNSEQEMYKKFKGLRFDVRVQVLDKSVDIDQYKANVSSYFDRDLES